MTLADYGPVIALWRRCTGIGLTPADTRRGIAAYLRRNPRMSFVATAAGGRIVGAVLCGHDGRRGYLHHLAVDPAWRRRGVGGALVDVCLARLRAAGIAKCNLFLYADNAAGRAFWRHHGWWARADLVLMQKPVLSAPAVRATSTVRRGRRGPPAQGWAKAGDGTTAPKQPR